MSNLYTERPSLSPKLNAFNLSHNHYTTMDFGWLYPVMWQECVPGDIFTLKTETLARALPLVSPILNNITMELEAFFVPSRLLWKKFEDFITTVDQESIPPKSFDGLPPVFAEADDGSFPDVTLKQLIEDTNASPSLWSRFGLPNEFPEDILNKKVKDLKEFLPVGLLFRAYYKIYNDWYRDENFQEVIDFTTNKVDYKLRRRAWHKDYFTASLYSRQKGTAPSIPLTGTGSAVFGVWNNSLKVPAIDSFVSSDYGSIMTGTGVGGPQVSGAIGNLIRGADQQGNDPMPAGTALKFQDVEKNLNDLGFQAYLNKNSIDMSNVGTFDVSDMRDMFAIQRSLEGLMIYGSKYIEVLQGIYGTSPTDARLQLAERIGGMSFNIRISEVLQTSESGTTPQGTQTGHGIGVSPGGFNTYKCEEFGYYIVFASVRPPAVYANRLPRELYRKTLLEQYSPYFVNLSFQAIHNREIYGQLNADDAKIWAYQGRYDEMRERQSYVSGLLRTELGSYIQVRDFNKLPSMNSDFIQCDPEDDIFAVVDKDKFICNFYFNLNALRPLPIYSEPGLIDHVYGGL